MLKLFRKKQVQYIEPHLGLLVKSDFLKRQVKVDVVLPGQHRHANLPVLFVNDGQDYGQLHMDQTLDKWHAAGKLPFVYVGIHCSQDRLQEYGVGGFPDYKKRGSKAQAHQDFVCKELIPYLESRFLLEMERDHTYYAGFSLGGLSAIDAVYSRPDLFTACGVFSGSFWWRSKDLNDGYSDDKHRIMHNKIRDYDSMKDLRFWFECGTADETSDRNKNGIIDSIEDTTDLIKILKFKGYPDDQIHYREVLKGEHNFNTWRIEMLHFLNWLFDTE